MKILRQLIRAVTLLALLFFFGCSMNGDSISETPQDTAFSKTVQERLLAD